MKRLRYHGKVLFNRLQAMPVSFDTKALKMELMIGEKTLRRWISDRHFRSVKVATQGADGFWIWNRDRLILWLIAIGTLILPKQYENELPVYSNPGGELLHANKESARAAFGMSAGYTIHKKRDSSKV